MFSSILLSLHKIFKSLIATLYLVLIKQSITQILEKNCIYTIFIIEDIYLLQNLMEIICDTVIPCLYAKALSPTDETSQTRSKAHSSTTTTSIGKGQLVDSNYYLRFKKGLVHKTGFHYFYFCQIFSCTSEGGAYSGTHQSYVSAIFSTLFCFCHTLLHFPHQLFTSQKHSRHHLSSLNLGSFSVLNSQHWHSSLILSNKVHF